MTSKIGNKSSLVLFLPMLLAIFLLSTSVYSFSLQEHIVNVDLYNYGLQFNSAWASSYWQNMILMLIYTGAAIVAIIASGVIAQFQTRSKKNYYDSICALVLLGILLTAFSAYFFVQNDLVVNKNLYDYGLRFSSNWSGQYGAYFDLSLGIFASAIIVQGFTFAYFFSGQFDATKTLKPRKTRSSKNVWLTLGAIAFRNIPRRKLRNALTVLAIVLGVTLMVGVNVAFENVLNQFKDTMNQAVGNVDLNVSSSLNTPFNQTLVSTINETSGVSNVYARVNNYANVSKGQNLFSADITGVDSGSDFDYLDLQTTNITGATQLSSNGTDAVVDARLNYTVGETITLNVTLNSDPLLAAYLNESRTSTDYNLTVVGIYHPSPLAIQSSGQYGEDYLPYTIYVDITKAQSMFNYGSKVDVVSVKLTNIKNTNQVLSELNLKLGSDYVVIPIKQAVLNIVESATSGLQSGLQIMSVMALCVAIVIVLNTMYMNVGERVHEIGILRSQGSSTGQVFWLFFSESLILGVVGVAIGLVTGMFSTQVFRYLTSQVFQTYSSSFSLNFSLSQIPVQYLIIGAATGMLTVIIGGLFPSLKACRTDIINVLRPSMRKPGKERTALKLVAVGLPLTIVGAFLFVWFDFFSKYGVGLFVASAFAPIPMLGVTLLLAGLLRSGSPLVERVLILFGKTRKIISRNIERNLLRSTICFALIGMSLSLVIVMGGAQIGTVMGVKSVVRSFSSSDITVSSKDLISKTFATNLTNIGYVDYASPVLAVPERVILLNNNTDSQTNSSATIVAIDPASYPKTMSMTFGQGTPSNVFTQLNNSGTIILTAPLAQSLNVTVNDTIQMQLVSLVLVPVYSTPSSLSATASGQSSISQLQNAAAASGYSSNTGYGAQTVPNVTVSYVPEEKITSDNFTVVGVAQGAWLDLLTIGGYPLSEASYISYNSLNETFPKYENNSNTFFLKTVPNHDVDSIKNNILNSYGNQYEISVSTYNDAVKQVSTSINQIFYILYSVVLFAVANSAIGVAAIMIMNVTERKREIGIFRSQGMSRGQLVASILGEAACLGFIGFITSVAVGLIFHRITVSYMRVAGFPMPYIIPYDAIWVSLVLAIVTSIVSAVYAANRASKLNIVESLRE